MRNTKILADEIVAGLGESLKRAGPPSFESVYAAGSYCRGDWLNCSSDLDIHVIFSDKHADQRENDARTLRTLAEGILAGRDFPAHCPGGVDYGWNEPEAVPRTAEEALTPSPYAYFSALMFDLRAHHLTLYGTELNDLLPEPPDPRQSAGPWLEFLVERALRLEEGNFRTPYITYKAVLALSLMFGAAGVSKLEILPAYVRNVPDFQSKPFGEALIRNYLGSFYPERPPARFAHGEYMSFLRDIKVFLQRA